MQDSLAQNSQTQDSLIQNSSSQNTPAQNTSLQDSITQDLPAQDPSIQDSITQDIPAQDPSIQDSVTQDAPAQDLPSQEFLIPDSPTGNSLTQDSLVIPSDTSAFASDSSLITPDSLSADTVKIDYAALDSTARLKHFRYYREDVPYIKLGRKRQSSFFAQPSQKVRTIQIDSTGNFVEIVEKVAGEETKILLKVPIEEYIDLQLALRERELWEQQGYKYELKETQKGLAELIKDITDFEIPLPSVGVLSIFGTPKISLRIGGAVDIHGAWRSETTEGATASRLGNTRNEPDFKQQVQINVSGTIGDKLNINADWNTERTFEYENQLKIKYTGYEDEIIQSIEAGNVSLQTSPLVGGGEALFGIKALFKMGPLSLTTIASQKKGEVKEVSVNSGSTSQEFSIRAYDYSTNHYFVDAVPIANDLFSRYYSRSPSKSSFEAVPELRVAEIEVWKSIQTSGRDPQREREANAYIELLPVADGGRYDNLRGNIEGVTGQVETGRFIKLEEYNDYILNREVGFITFKTQVQDNDVIAIAFQRDNGEVYGEFIKTAVSDTQKLVLKLVKPRNLNSTHEIAWQLQLKNIYPVGGRNINAEGFEFKIKYEVEGGEPETDISTPNGIVRLLNAFGLDIYDAASTPNPDNIFDYSPQTNIIPETGEIIFPTLEPFGRNLPFADTSRAYYAIYDTLPGIARYDKAKDKWLLTGKFSGQSSSVYQLGFNIVENSVRVTLNGGALTPGIDYVVDYNLGQLTIRNDAALVPGADLKITYEQNDLFQLASKTLLGARGVFDFTNKTKLGFSILNLNQQTLSDKVRIGEEPLSNTIMGVDFATSHDLPFITKGLDNLFSTRTMSTISLAGEYAYIDPDPNTKKSTIVSDNGESIAYIDDFEGTKRTIPIGVSYLSWRDMSAPSGTLPVLTDLTPNEKMGYKGRAFWFTENPSRVRVKEIWPLRSVSREDQDVTIMDFVFEPYLRGQYNYRPTLDNRRANWGGMMKTLSSSANNLIEENVEFIEIWMKPDLTPSTNIAEASFYVDLGRISEDIIPGDYNTEDREPFNGVMDINYTEDTGLDRIFDAEERVRYPESEYPGLGDDPSGDNFFLPSIAEREGNLFAWRYVNGTEGNARSADLGAQTPDTEDMNNNGSTDRVDSYFRYRIPLDTTSNNPFIAGGGSNGWYLYRIPLKEVTEEVGSPNLSSVEYIRLFVTGFDTVMHMRIAEFNLVGSQWQKAITNDSILSVSVINVEENPEYSIPPGVDRERDRTRPDENILRNEQSMNLVVVGLEPGQSREAVKFLPRPLDVFNYNQMKLFVHGQTPDSPNFVGSLSDNNGGARAEVYFRFGADSNNYYEYRQPIEPGWGEISIPFSELTAIKGRRDSTEAVDTITVPGKPGHFYGLKGQPSLTIVKFLTVGIRNITGRDDGVGEVLSGDVWINELRVIGADDTPGWAYSMSGSMVLADLLKVSFTVSQTNPFFHRLSDRFGSRVESRNWGVTGELDILKLLPFTWEGSNLKLNYSHTENIGKPLYMPGTDILVAEAENNGITAAADQMTMNVSDTWSASNIKIKIPTDFWLIRDSFNSLTFGFNYNKTFSKSPTVLVNKSWVWNSTVAYGINLSPEYFLSPVDIPVLGSVFALLTDYKGVKFYYTPQNFAFNISARRNRNTNVTRERRNVPSQMVISRDFTTQRGFNFSWRFTEGGLLNLSTTYNLNISSSLAHLETDEILDEQGKVIQIQRPESQIWKEIFSSAFFGKDYQYTQSIDFRTAPKLPSLWDINRYFTITASYSVNYQWQHDLKQEELGRSAGFASRSSIGLSLRLKALAAPLFDEKDDSKTQNLRGNNRSRNLNEPRERTPRNRGRVAEGSDSLNLLTPDPLVQNDSLAEEISVGDSPVTQGLSMLKTIARIIFFDYENITINFSNDNSLSKSGIYGKGTGFNNFWGIGSFQGYNGPSRGFMFGLSQNVGLRAPGGNLSDVFSQKNNLDFKTSKPLWEGAKIDLNWKVSWTVNKTINIITSADTLGLFTVRPPVATGSLTRSFLAFPNFLFISGGIKKVHELYNPDAPDPTQSLTDAFATGFEQFPILAKLPFLADVAKYIPRPNWRVVWDGLEKYFIFSSFAQKVSFDHAYTSSFTEGWKTSADGTQQIQGQRVEYGFAPLAGLSFTFNKLWGGTFNSSFKYGTKTIYDLSNSTSRITETFSRDFGITANYSLSGIEVPLFGISLQNDIEFSFSYTNTKNSSIIFDMKQFVEDGTPQDGTTRITLEPRAKYSLSSKVTLSVFYRNSSVTPEGAAKYPPTTTNEVGLDVHISIQ
ncbi:MAG: cell surface protein SprA [Ignavibacteriaceae bacterium]